jgi:ferritin-like metal-binding protein YciE
MPITTAKELFVTLLSELRQGAERSSKIYDELGQAAENPEIKEALNAREFITTQILSRLDECFRLLGEKPVKVSGKMHDMFLEDFRRELTEIQSPIARRLFVLAKASRLMHLRIGEYVALIAVADTLAARGETGGVTRFTVRKAGCPAPARLAGLPDSFSQENIQASGR